MKFRMGEKLSFEPWSAGPLLPVPRHGLLRWRVVLVVVPFAPVSAQHHGGGDMFAWEVEISRAWGLTKRAASRSRGLCHSCELRACLRGCRLRRPCLARSEVCRMTRRVRSNSCPVDPVR